jgi:hypothetical protein
MRNKTLFLRTSKTETQWFCKRFAVLPILASLVLGFSACASHGRSKSPQVPYVQSRPCGESCKPKKNSGCTANGGLASCIPHLISSPQEACEHYKKSASRNSYPAKLDPNYNYLHNGNYDKMQRDFRHTGR